MAKVTIIAIVARNGAIGRGGDQPFHISADFRRFKQLTTGKPIVMGRRTFEALPSGALPHRRNIVVTRNQDYRAKDAETAPSLEAAVNLCSDAEDIMVIGGGEIYRQAMPLASTLMLTEVDADVDNADTFFPTVDRKEWVETERSERFTDPKSGVCYTFATYSRTI
ncbi:MAG: dihydrofolate reductase [Firmicutes bacterium]|nr:dihydrofolate reductase [Bacillota bacterium]MCM1400685.1 dihydrofolate reductase [Bacteroides sp.]MCM1476379.1 dihydrofolate reductase [Bacteroides sp.]